MKDKPSLCFSTRRIIRIMCLLLLVIDWQWESTAEALTVGVVYSASRPCFRLVRLYTVFAGFNRKTLTFISNHTVHTTVGLCKSPWSFCLQGPVPCNLSQFSFGYWLRFKPSPCTFLLNHLWIIQPQKGTKIEGQTSIVSTRDRQLGREPILNGIFGHFVTNSLLQKRIIC